MMFTFMVVRWLMTLGYDQGGGNIVEFAGLLFVIMSCLLYDLAALAGLASKVEKMID